MSVDELQKTFLSRNWTLSIAESCTGGQLSALVASRAGASGYFLGGVISYHSSVKNKLLKVPTSAMECFGEVSETVALSMAQGVRAEINSTWSISITGIAGPTGGTVEKPVGTVCFAIAGPAGQSWTKTKFFGEQLTRTEIQAAAVSYAIHSLNTFTA